MRYLVAGTKSWNRRVFQQVISRFPGEWAYIEKPEDLTIDMVKSFGPRYIFFLHWSWKVPADIVRDFECVCFHMADVPYGRGGSPLQNLILRGHARTKLAALRMTEEMDAGPVYLKEDLSLEGVAEDTYVRATDLSAKMIHEIVTKYPVPVPQAGQPTVFKRRKPAESEIGKHEELRSLYDFIRMLDAEGYPRAFLEHEGFRYEFSRAHLYEGRIIVDVRITPAGNQ